MSLHTSSHAYTHSLTRACTRMAQCICVYIYAYAYKGTRMPLVWLLVLLCVLCILGCIAKLLARSIHRAHIYTRVRAGKRTANPDKGRHKWKCECAHFCAFLRYIQVGCCSYTYIHTPAYLVSLTMLCCCAVNVIIHTEAHECKGRGACIQIFFNSQYVRTCTYQMPHAG